MRVRSGFDLIAALAVVLHPPRRPSSLTKRPRSVARPGGTTTSSPTTASRRSAGSPLLRRRRLHRAPDAAVAGAPAGWAPFGYQADPLLPDTATRTTCSSAPRAASPRARPSAVSRSNSACHSARRVHSPSSSPASMQSLTSSLRQHPPRRTRALAEPGTLLLLASASPAPRMRAVGPPDARALAPAAVRFSPELIPCVSFAAG